MGTAFLRGVQLFCLQLVDLRDKVDLHFLFGCMSRFPEDAVDPAQEIWRTFVRGLLDLFLVASMLLFSVGWCWSEGFCRRVPGHWSCALSEWFQPGLPPLAG